MLGKEEVKENESSKGGRNGVLDHVVCYAKFIGFPNTVPTSISGNSPNSQNVLHNRYACVYV